MLFKQGDLDFRQTQFLSAGSRYLLAADPAFQSMERENFSKARRKAALCYLHASQYSKAENVIRMTLENTASDHYVLFLCAARQGLQDKGGYQRSI